MACCRSHLEPLSCRFLSADQRSPSAGVACCLSRLREGFRRTHVAARVCQLLDGVSTPTRNSGSPSSKSERGLGGEVSITPSHLRFDEAELLGEADALHLARRALRDVG